ncbi:MAG: ABC transporter permease [Archangiaceae bacterium]|nr:ABC transporter permease [Archangiaceae bacterium]
MSLTASLSYFGRTALNGIWRSPFVHVIAVSSLAIALVGFGLARMAQAQLDKLLYALGGEVEMTVYLADGTTPEKIAELQSALAQRTSGQTRLVSPAEALGRLAEQLGQQGEALQSLAENPLPWSVEVTLPPLAREPEALEQLSQKVRTLPFVTQVDYGQEALERLTAIARALKLGSLIAFVLVFLTAVVVVSATLQLAIYSRREDIEIQKLVGATDRFVRAPFLIEGLLQGVVAATLAALALWAFALFVGPRLAALFSFLDLGTAATRPSPRLLLELYGIGAAMGLCGSVVAVRRFLHV